MTKIRYRLADGQVLEIDVPDDVAEVTVGFEREERNAGRRARWRKERSIEAMEERGAEIADTTQNVESAVEAAAEAEKIRAAVERLNPRQQALIKQIYFEGRTLTDIAKEQEKSPSAVYQQLQTVHKKLKKFLKNP